MEAPRSMIEMNGLIQRAFRVHHGRDGPLQLPRWWAEQVRACVAAIDPDNAVLAGRLWAGLSRRQQQDRVLAHVGTIPTLLRGKEWQTSLSTSR